MELVDTESLVPQEHVLREVVKAIDFRKLYEIVEPLYCEEDGRPGVDPVVLFKIVLPLCSHRWFSRANAL